MRRQARISAGGALVMRSASALQVWLWLLIFVFQNKLSESETIKPGYLDFDNLPETNFTCEGKVIGGYYADLETSCQMFHVCTVGQQEEPMDIKFLCLNGTVFDQETRVCERVDEVDCTKSEKFYSLNLELYGSTLPPLIKPEVPKPSEKPTEQTHQENTPSVDEESDPSIDDHHSSSHHKPSSHSTDVHDSTEDPIQEEKQTNKPNDTVQPTFTTSTGDSSHVEPVEENQEEEEIDSEDEYEDDYSHHSSTTQSPTTTTSRQSSTTTLLPLSSSQASSLHSISPPTLTHNSLSPPTHASPSSSEHPTLDPALLSPQEFIYHHRAPGSDAISFQRQSFRPADGVYITHAPQQQYDHFQYESSRTAPRPGGNRPVAFSQRPAPAPFRATTLDPRDQILRPGPSSQPSERYETAVKHRPQPYLPPLPAQRPLPYDQLYYDRKRSDDTHSENESSLSARSVAPPTVTERPPTKPKSPPRVIVTASASVSDSNGKRLNYTVGNVVSAVKPIVPINYDDYKESDLIFDPFFLDVPKLQKRRKTRDSRVVRKVFTVPAIATIASDSVIVIKTTTSPLATQATTTERSSMIKLSTTTVAWNPNDYVDDNYEPHAYVQPVPARAVFVPFDRNKYTKQDRKSNKNLVDDRHGHKFKVRSEESKAAPLAAQSAASSQRAVVAPGPALHAACLPSTSDCRTRA